MITEEPHKRKEQGMGISAVSLSLRAGGGRGSARDPYFFTRASIQEMIPSIA
jgi:hypothetical protein